MQDGFTSCVQTMRFSVVWRSCKIQQDSSALNTPILKGPYITEALQHASRMVPDPEEMQL